MKHTLIAVLSVILLSSCQTLYTTTGDGTAVLSRSCFKLPRAIGGFHRQYIRAFDQAGYDMGAGYNYYSEDLQTAITVYIVSAPDRSLISEHSADKYFDASQNEIIQAHQGARKLGRYPLIAHGDRSFWQEYEYDEVFAHKSQRLVSYLAVFNTPKAMIKYRATAPFHMRERVLGSLRQFVEGLSETN